MLWAVVWGFLQHGISQSNDSLKDTHWWSLSSRCEDLLAADIKSQEQEIKQMDDASCQFVFWREKAMVLHPSADFLIKGVNTMVTFEYRIAYRYLVPVKWGVWASWLLSFVEVWF